MKAAAIVLAVLALAPAAAASAFTSTGVQASWAMLDAAGALLKRESPGPGDSFTLEAGSVRLAMDWERQRESGLVSINNVSAGREDGPITRVQELGATSMVARAWDSSPVAVLDARTATVRGTAGQGSVAMPDGCVAMRHFFIEGKSACLGTGGTLELQASARQWVVTGNFSLVLWAWEGAWTNATDTKSFWTGTHTTRTYLPDVAGRPGLRDIEMQQAYLHVTDGRLVLTLAGDAPLDVHSPTLSLSAASILDRQGGDGGPIFAGGHGGDLTFSREPIGPSSTALSPASAKAGGPLAWLLPAALLLPVGAVLARRQGARVHLRLAARNMTMGNPAAAARHAAKATRLRSQAVEASVIGAIACLRVGDGAGAQGFVDRLHALPAHDEAACQYLTAHVRMGQGRTQEGEEALERCLALDGSYTQEAAADPVLAPFLDPSKWPRAV